LSQRLNASVLNYLVDARISTNMIWQTYPVFRIVLLLIAGTWLIQFLVKRVYKQIQKSASPAFPRKNGIGWFLVFLLLTGLAIFGRVGQYPLRWSDAFS